MRSHESFALLCCCGAVARQSESVGGKGAPDARLVNLLSFCVAPVGCGKCLRAPWVCKSWLLTAQNTVERSGGCSTTDSSTGTTSATVFARFCFLLFGKRFSLQSWCVQWSRGSAEGSVLPPSGGQEVSNSWVHKKPKQQIYLKTRLIKPLLHDF